MARIVLISCFSSKLPHKAKARDLYISDLFKKSFRYAESLNPDKIFILSAKHKLLPLEKQIEPYDQTLNKMPAEERRRWASKVLKQLEDESDLDNDEFIFLAGVKYREHLLPHIRNYEVPTKGLRFGEQLKYLNDMVADE